MLGFLDRVFLALLGEQHASYPGASPDQCWRAAEYRFSFYVGLPTVLLGVGAASFIPAVESLMRADDLLYVQLGACVIFLLQAMYFGARFNRFRGSTVAATSPCDAQLLRRFRIAVLAACVSLLAWLVWLGGA